MKNYGKDVEKMRFSKVLGNITIDYTARIGLVSRVSVEGGDPGM